VYAAAQKKPVNVTVKAGQKTTAAQLSIAGSPAPDLLPEVIKYLKGYQNDKPIPEYITREIIPSGMAAVVKRP
jgi:hypothetical protein